jgi:hypothetical protein
VREAIKPLCRALRDGTLNNSSNSSITLQKQFQLGLLLQALLELKLITRESPFGWLRRKINNIFVNYPVFNLLIRFMVAVISFVLKLVTGYFIFHYGKNLINYCRGRKRGSSSAVYHAGYHAMVADAMSLGERGCKSNLDRGHSVTDFIRGLQTVYYQSESGHLPTFDERHLECDHHKDVVDEGDSHKINMVQGSSGVSAPNDGGHQGGDHRRSSDFCRWLYPRMVFLRKEKEYFGPDISVNDFLSSATSLR